MIRTSVSWLPQSQFREAVSQTIFDAVRNTAFREPRFHHLVEPLAELQSVAAIETVPQVRLERFQRLAGQS